MVESHPAERVALIDEDLVTTYGQLRDRAAGVRGALVAAGRRPGDRVALVSGNDEQFVVGLLGILGAGMVAVLLNPQSPPAELEPELTVVGASTVLVGPAGRRLSVVGAVPVAEAATHDPAPIAPRAPDDTAVLVFTSGTAGPSRAAMLTHGNLRANIDQVAAVTDLRRRPDDVTLGVLPLFHVFGLNVVLLPALEAGARVVLLDHFDAGTAVRLVVEHGVTTLTGPPTLWRSLLALPADAAAPTVLSTVRIAASGAAPLPVDLAEAVLDRFGVRVHEGYGLTETSPVVATSAGTEAPIGSIGRPLAGVEVRLVDLDGDDVLVGDVGEILVRGANVFPGYWGVDETAASVLDHHGWLHTGDLGTVDDDGYLYIVGRLKDLVIVSGFNVYPAEVEEVLLDHPSVAEAAVVGEPHPRTGEAVVAYVVPADGHAVDPDALIAAVGDRLARYKCPHEIRIVDRIPRGMGGKILRRKLDGPVG